MASQEVPVTMQVADFLRMNSGNQESSYASNSSVQEMAIRKMESVIKETINSIANHDGFPHCFTVADLGCSSGPNTLYAVSNIINGVHEACKEKNLKPPQYQVCLNDLFINDFNSVFESLPLFYAKHKKEKGQNSPCYVSAVPGSFHGRLFPDQSVHFFHSSSSLHWLSEVPKDIENNKLNINIWKTSPPNVFENYKKQFQKDFTTFLESRSIEIVRGGRMVLTLVGRSDVDPCGNEGGQISNLIARSLVDLTKEGLIRESDINSFNIPVYNAYSDEIREIIHSQGSFSLDMLETFGVDMDPYGAGYENEEVSDEAINHGKRAAKVMRAAIEPVLVTHFGNSAMDLLFKKLEKNVDEHLATETTKYFNIVISLTKI